VKFPSHSFFRFSRTHLPRALWPLIPFPDYEVNVYRPRYAYLETQAISGKAHFSCRSYYQFHTVRCCLCGSRHRGKNEKM